jgi:hypothetical protein
MVKKIKKSKNKDIFDMDRYDLGIFEINRYGIMSLTNNGRILFLFLTEVLGFWFVALVIRNWSNFVGNDYGLTVIVFSICVASFLFISIFYKENMKFQNSEYLKQLGILLFIILVYLVLYNYDKLQFEELYYLNPMKILYTFILFYMLAFYLVQNMIK